MASSAYKVTSRRYNQQEGYVARITLGDEHTAIEGYVVSADSTGGSYMGICIPRPGHVFTCSASTVAICKELLLQEMQIVFIELYGE